MNVEQQILLGVEALKTHNMKQAFDHLFEAAHHDKEALRLFLRIPVYATRMHLLTVDQIALAKREAKKGDALAQYVFGRYHQLFKPDQDSPQKAIDLFEACKDEIPEALCAQAIMLVDGYYGEVDFERYDEWLKEAIEKGSMHAFRKRMIDTTYGRCNTKTDTQAVIEKVKAYLNGNESDDLRTTDPFLYHELGNAYIANGEKELAIHYFTKAADMGHYESLPRLCFCMGCDKDGYVVNQKAFDLALKTGCQFMDPTCICFRAEFSNDEFEKLSPEEQKEKHQQIDEDLHTSFELGEELAPCILGFYYYYGRNGYKQDYTEAWNWFLAGARMEDDTSFAMLAEMIKEGQQPGDLNLSDEFMEYCQLSALRRGDQSQVNAVVDAYHEGKLAFAATEIEKYYVPLYEEAEDDEDEYDEDDEEHEEEEEYEPDPLPLKLMAIIQPDGKAYIHEYNVEEDWDDLPAMIDARRLDAIRTQPLYDLSKKMHYFTKHITAWVDNMGLLRGLRENRIGCMLYPGSIVGDLILTLEDNRYEPMSFDNLDKLKKILAELGANLIAVYLDDGPDDDGRYDAWS